MKHVNYTLWAHAFAEASVNEMALEALVVAWQHYRTQASAGVVLTGVQRAGKIVQGDGIKALQQRVMEEV